MRVNHGSTLSVDYFVSYLNLVMKSRALNLSDAVSYMEQEFFQGDVSIYGESAERNFECAIQQLK